MQPDITNKADIVNCTDDGKNTGCGPATPDHFNYGDDRHENNTTQTDNEDQDVLERN